jgi:hypothetical protein
MSNAFMGQRQQASPMGFGGFGGYQQPQPFSPFSGGYGGGMGGFPQGGGMMYGDMMYRGPGATGGGPMGGGMGGFGTTFGGYGMGGGGYDMGYGGSPLLPPPQPTVNDLFSQYFSQQYYGGPAFNPFAATSFFGGGYGGGFGFGGGGGMGRRGRGGRMRPQPMPVQDDRMYAGGSPGLYQNQGFTDMRARLPDRLMQPATIGAPPPRLSQLFASEFSPMQYSGPQDQLAMQLTEPARSAVMPQPEPVMRPAVMPQPPPQFTPQPYMGGFSLPFDSALPAKMEAPVAPAVQGVETIMPVPVQDTPVQSAPVYAPAPFVPPAPSYVEPAPYVPPAPAYVEPAPYTPPAPTYVEPAPYIPPAPAYIEPAPFVPPAIEPVYAPAAPSFFDDRFLSRGGMYR